MTAQSWISCPSCSWNYNQHGDTHMSTRFNCRRARNANAARSETAEHYAPTELNRYTGTISQVDADRQTEVVKTIMTKQGLDYGPAYDVYIATHHMLLHSTTALGHRTCHD